jgi:hypothetical protein
MLKTNPTAGKTNTPELAFYETDFNLQFLDAKLLFFYPNLPSTSLSRPVFPQCLHNFPPSQRHGICTFLISRFLFRQDEKKDKSDQQVEKKKVRERERTETSELRPDMKER